ncbi:DoxX family protein [Rubrobacter indicoceani]|uniref:DoxX family protein n=1 Tax=Rubrobacter indicoceani TaxID=2051957 RepID=UPI0019690E66|nr:DoxX family protein [Rubrobacter indicoceani]
MKWLVRYSITVLRVSLGAIFLGFGLLKFFPGLSPAADLATQTTSALTFGLIPASVSILLVATLECIIGLGLLSGRFMRLILLLLGFQMLGAMSPILLFSGQLFAGPWHAPTLEAQYVIKDVVLIGAGLVIGATLHGGRIVTERVRRAEDYRRYIPPSKQALTEPVAKPRLLEKLRVR